MITNGPETINTKKFKDSIENFETKNHITNEEKEELEFICVAFKKFYNNISKNSRIYTAAEVAELFDEALKAGIGPDNGFQTRANILYKRIPYIKDIIKSDTLEETIESNTVSPSNIDPCHGATWNDRSELC